jgi:hypothetical protein
VKVGGWIDRAWGWALFSPSCKPIVCTKERVELEIEGGSVELWGEKWGTVQNPGYPELVVLRLLGARGRAELATRDPARFIPSVTSIVTTVNQGGFGAARGTCTLLRYFLSIGAAFDRVAADFPHAKIWVHGKSIGGLGALYLAATRSPHAIVVRNVVDVAGIATERAGGAIAQIIPAALDARRWAAQGRCPALFVVSSGDRLARSACQRKVIQAFGGRKEMLQVGGAHDDRELRPADVPRYAEALSALWSSL